MNYRPYPRVDRARHQVKRGRWRPYHYIRQRADGVIEETYIHSTDALTEFARGMKRLESDLEKPDTRPLRDALRALADRMPTSASTASQALARAAAGAEAARARAEAAGTFLDHPRRTGKTAIVAAIVDQAVKDGEHVHVATMSGVRCAGGDSTCPFPRKGRERPLILARVVRTCTTTPSQWDAWTIDGQYLYLRYRSGIGTVDAFDSPDPETWPHLTAGLIALFEHGDWYAGEMTLAEFCERAGLQLADNAEVTGE
ncbi:hypothetical protein [Streptomyces sp. STR69]|uniref:hypothetical protein n=1 Tax=Streptomyces sp. STR69 TaxID=1796942 RepID=UPI0021C890AC|nr:hypothetical protein [Streptomyces sp. STR69]